MKECKHKVLVEKLHCYICKKCRIIVKYRYENKHIVSNKNARKSIPRS